MAWVDLTSRKTRSMAHVISWDYPIGSSSPTGYFSRATFSGTLGYKVQYDDSKDLTDTDSMRVVVDIDCSLSMAGNHNAAQGSNYINVAILAWEGSTGGATGYPNLYGDVSGAINQVHNYFGGSMLLAGGASDSPGGSVSTPQPSYSGTKYIYFDYSDLDSQGRLTVRLPLSHQRRYLDSSNNLTGLASSAPTWISVDLSDLKLVYFPWAIMHSGDWDSTDRDDNYTDHLVLPTKAGLRIMRSNVWDACVNTTEYESGVDHGFIMRSDRWVTSILHGND